MKNLRNRLFSRLSSDFSRRVIWFTILSGFERVFALAQTIIISRALGITDYGAYGMLFGTIGFIASIVGLQMGLAATVYVSKYRENQQSMAAAVISVVNRFGWILAVIFILVASPFSASLSVQILGAPGYAIPTFLGILFVGMTIVSGVQDGIAQGFEIFDSLAKLKIVSSILIFALIFLGKDYLHLSGVLCLQLTGLLFKYLVLRHLIRRCRKIGNIPASGTGVSFRSLVGGFALPSMAVSLMVGLLTWGGMFLLSRQSMGLAGVAIANTGQQWRGPVLMIAAAVGGVAVPAFSRLSSSDPAGLQGFRRKLIAFNLLISGTTVLGVIVFSGFIMKLYGPGFAVGRLAFCLIMISTVPTVIVNVYMQQVVGMAKMWYQFWIHLPYLFVTGILLVVLIPKLGIVGFAASFLLGNIFFLLEVILADRFVNSRRRDFQLQGVK